MLRITKDSNKATTLVITVVLATIKLIRMQEWTIKRSIIKDQIIWHSKITTIIITTTSTTTTIIIMDK